MRFYQVVCMIGLLFIHNYNYAPMVITPSTVVSGKSTISEFIELFVSNSFLRFRLPLLMAISGYLMANSKELPFAQLFIKKFKSLMIPYFLISIIGLALTVVFEFLIYGMHSSTGLLGKSLWHLDFRDFLNIIFVNPVSFQLWYLKTIFILALISPVINYILKRVSLEVLSLLFLVWMFSNQLGGDTRDRGYIFYILGFYLRLYNINISKPISFFKPIYALYLFIIICFIRTGFAFTSEYISHIKNVLTLLYKLNEMLGLYACWFCFDKFISIIVEKKWYKQTSSSSFFIFAFHAPLINYVGKFLMLKHFYIFSGSHILTYVLIPLFLFPILVLLDKLFHKYTPKFYLLFTGKRNQKQNEAYEKYPSPSVYNHTSEYSYLNIGLFI